MKCLTCQFLCKKKTNTHAKELQRQKKLAKKSNGDVEV